jgi:hypothetical protein
MKTKQHRKKEEMAAQQDSIFKRIGTVESARIPWCLLMSMMMMMMYYTCS